MALTAHASDGMMRCLVIFFEVDYTWSCQRFVCLNYAIACKSWKNKESDSRAGESVKLMNVCTRQKRAIQRVELKFTL
jgi:hypothetical protein